MKNRLFFILKINLFKNQPIIQIISILKIKLLFILYTDLIVSEKIFKTNFKYDLGQGWRLLFYCWDKL